MSLFKTLFFIFRLLATFNGLIKRQKVSLIRTEIKVLLFGKELFHFRKKPNVFDA